LGTAAKRRCTGEPGQSAKQVTSPLAGKRPCIPLGTWAKWIRTLPARPAPAKAVRILQQKLYI
jgi:hypothetical protein